MIPSHRRVNANPKDPAFYQNPYRLYSAQRQHEMFFWEQYNMWCAASFKLVNALLRDRRFARSMPDGSKHKAGDDNAASASADEHLKHFHQVERYSLLNLEGGEHTRIRSLVNHAFMSRQVNNLAPQIEQMSLALLNELRPGGSADLLPRYATPLPARIIARMLGVPGQHVPSLLEWSHAMVKVYTMVQDRQDEIAADNAAREFSALLADLIGQRRQAPGQDLLSHLVQAQVNGESLRDEELISTAVLLLNAGHEATVHQSGNAIKTILESGLDPQQLFESAEQTTRTIRELMRFDAPLHLFIRYALQNVELDGITLRKGEQIGLLLGAANRDAIRFKDPDRFDPWRTDGGHVTLGAGVHYCVGAQLARLELEISLPMVFRELPGLHFVSKPVYKDAFHFHGLEALELGWDAQV